MIRPFFTRLHRTAAPLLLLFAATCSSAAAVSARLLVEPSQETYYAGQSVRLILQVEVSDGDLSNNLRIGGLSSGARIEVGTLEPLTDERRTIDGKLVTINRFAAPLRLLEAGTINFEPLLSGMVEQRTRSGWSSFITSQTFRTRVARLTLTVVPLPEPVPDDFCGAIGNFKIVADISPTTASPGDLVTLRWHLQGQGSLNEFHPPETAAFVHGKTYSSRIESLEEGKSVSVTQVFVPDSLEAHEIPVLQMKYFNPHSGTYEELTAGPFPLTMQPRTVVVTDPTTPTNALKPTVAAPTGTRLPESPDWQVPPARVVTPLLVLLAGIALSLMLLIAVAAWSRWLAVVLALLVVTGTVVVRRTLDRQTARDQLTLPAVAESRLCPSANARRLGSIPAGTQVRILERTGPWLRVEQNGQPSVWIVQPENESTAAP